MANEWWYAKHDQRLGPVSWDELRRMAEAGTLLASDLVWKEGLGDWQAASTVPGLVPAGVGVPPLDTFGGMTRSEIQNKKLAAGICGILLNGLGIHKFILGMNTAGIIMLLVSVVGGCVTVGVGAIAMTVIGLIEGIIYLTKSDEEFYQTYIVEKKEWF